MPKKLFLIHNKRITFKEISEILENYTPVGLAKNCQKKVKDSEDYLASLVRDKVLIYGINTGYGPLATSHIPEIYARELQRNLIYHLASGVGENLSIKHVRAILLARIICLSKGYSAIRLESLNLLIKFFNLQISPLIPSLGTVGASGDLTPLAHMVLAFMGETKVYYNGKIYPSKKILKMFKIKPLELDVKEGLAIVNGTSAMTGIAAVNGMLAQRALDISTSLSLLYAEIMEAKEEAFHILIGKVKPHLGIQEILRVWQKISKDSKRFKTKKSFQVNDTITYDNELLQDAYSIRCIPQILGSVVDTIQFHNETVTTEINSVTDNPIFFPSEKIILHGGNFQGHSIALASDSLFNAITNLAIHSERKIARITDPLLNKGLPAFLQSNKNGLHSGFMGAQVTATALLGWIRANSTPASIQSISTNANNQDVVSMGTIAALKSSQCIDRTFEILAIEAMVMAQAFELRKGFEPKSGYSEHSIQFVKKIRKISPFLKEDRSLSEEIKKLSEKLKQEIF